MEVELLTEILAAEREVTERISRIEAESSRMLEVLEKELTAANEREIGLLQAETARVSAVSEQEARLAANALLEEAGTYAARIGSIGDDRLQRTLARHLERLRPEGMHDRQDEQD